jgi:LuxR family maltose regulon positive regulatory protein
MISSTELQVGSLLNERYRLDAKLGQGGMGVVYSAHDTLLDRDVAIKVVSATVLSAESRARLLREAQAAAKLNHPNIVSVYDAGEACPEPVEACPESVEGPGVPFIVMELVKGESLYNIQVTGERRPRALEDTLSIAKQICAALEHAHAHGIIHRDLKPENVLIAPDGSAKLMDFGLAHIATSRRITKGAIVGTVFYLAPEQAVGGEIDSRVDLYALGVMLYELTAGRLPFTGDDPLAVISQHLHAPVVPPSAHSAAIPPAFDALIVRLLGKRPEDRPASATEVRQALDGLTLVTQVRPATGWLERRRETGTTHLLQTKLYIPPVRPELVPRPRLIGRLNVGLYRKLTVISAPAGFGKTTLLSEWIHQSDVPAAWLSLDEGDNDPVRFWPYVIAALQTIQPDLGQAALSMLEPAEAASAAAVLSMAPFAVTSVLSSIETVLTSLINEIVESTEEDTSQSHPYVLILDDYHLIDAQDIHEGLSFLLDHLPSQLHLVIASRADPPLPLSRLRGRNQLTELRAADLRFTPDEAAAFLNRAMGLSLSAEQVAALEARTEGWIVGLQMVALSVQRRGGEHIGELVSSLAGAAGRYVLDYLADEVLSQQSEDIRAFLVQTCILDRLTGPLCDAVLGKERLPLAGDGSPSDPSLPRILDRPSDGYTTLEYLERADLFVVALDDRGEWYRYHYLFADLLQRHLQRTCPDLVPALHRRASEWHEREGLVAEAISHALSAADHGRAAEFIVQQVLAALSCGEFGLVRRWLEALPEGLIHRSPILCVARAWTLLMVNSLDLAEGWLQDAEVALTAGAYRAESLDGANRAIYSQVTGNVAVIRAMIARSRGEPTQKQMTLARHALEVVPESDFSLRSTITVWLGLCHMDLGEEDAADRTFRQAWELGIAGGGHWAALFAVYARTIIARRHGRLKEAAAICREALESIVEPAERSRHRSPFGLGVYLTLGRVLLEWNDLDGAERALIGWRELGGLNEISVKSGFAYARLRLVLCQG